MWYRYFKHFADAELDELRKGTPIGETLSKTFVGKSFVGKSFVSKRKLRIKAEALMYVMIFGHFGEFCIYLMYLDVTDSILLD